MVSHTVRIFYGTEIEIWAGFGLVGSTEKSGTLLRTVFLCFHREKKYFFSMKVSALKSCITSIQKKAFDVKFFKIFLAQNRL